MPTFLPRRRLAPSAILLTALLSGCRDDPAPLPDGRATQVPASDKPASEKATPSAAALPRTPVAPVVKPALNLPSAALSASAAPSASAAAEAPAAPVDPPLDCDKILTPEDVLAACKVKVEAPADQPTEDIGAEPRCTRRFNSKDAGALTLIIVRHASNAEAEERYNQDFKVELSKPEPIEGVDGRSRYFLKKGVSGDPILTAEAIKERFNVTVFNPKVTVGGQTVGPVCDDAPLKKLFVEVMKRMP